MKFSRIPLLTLLLGVSLPMHAAVNVTVDTSAVARTLDARFFGVNTAAWDSHLASTNTLALVQELGVGALRFPGGSMSDEYHWARNSGLTNKWRWPVDFNQFARLATAVRAQAFITVNYGSGTPAEAAAWVRHANVTNKFGFKYWEIGNEIFGSWEHDENIPAHDPFTYAARAKEFITEMKAADPTIKIGVVVVEGEDKYANYTNHSALNPRTDKSHHGWTPVLLAQLKELSVTPDFAIFHRYPQNTKQENDAKLLQSAAKWPADAADLRQQLKDYLGDAHTNVELVVTENNSVSSNTGKQTTSLVNALFLADSFASCAPTEFNSLLWWDLRNGEERQNNNRPSLYGWRGYGDYGLLHGRDERYPTFYALKLLQHFVRGGDKILRATSDNSLLTVHAAQRADGSLTLLVINKSPTENFTADFALAGYAATTNATVDRKSTRLNSSHGGISRMPSSA